MAANIHWNIPQIEDISTGYMASNHSGVDHNSDVSKVENNVKMGDNNSSKVISLSTSLQKHGISGIESDPSED
jgi:hypothetical protein